MLGACKPISRIFFSLFQASVKKKPIPSIVSHISSLCKKWNHSHPIPWFLFLLAFFYYMSLGFLIPSSPSSWPITHFHLDFTLSWGIVVMSGFYPFLLIFVCFEQFHYDWNQSLSFIPLIPLGGTHFYNFFGLHKLTKKEPHGVFFQPFLDSQNMKILPSTRVFELIKINEKTST